MGSFKFKLMSDSILINDRAFYMIFALVPNCLIGTQCVKLLQSSNGLFLLAITCHKSKMNISFLTIAKTRCLWSSYIILHYKPLSWVEWLAWNNMTEVCAISSNLLFVFCWFSTLLNLFVFQCYFLNCVYLLVYIC